MLSTNGLTKKFGGNTALDDVSFSVHEGEVHSLLGENGAGKSTLINMIVGTFGPTAGEITFEGRKYPRMTPGLARSLGIAAVFQEFSLAPDLTVLENLFLANERSKLGFLRKRDMRTEARALMARLSFDVPLDAMVGRLSRAQRQMVEIAKAVRTEPRILILDEPTASLTDGEAQNLFKVIGLLKAKGVAIIYVSHRMPEIRLLSDRTTVLRGGKYIGTVDTKDVSDSDLIAMMVGRPASELFPEILANPQETILELNGLKTANGAVVSASFYARAGEVVGLAGLVGCGRSEVCRAIFGIDEIADGQITFKGNVIASPRPSSMLKRGICYFPADRGLEGLATSRPARENVTMAGLDLPSVSAGPFLKFRQERQVIEAPLKELGLRPFEPEKPVHDFSGGNRQKVMLARGLLRDFDVYIFDEPTVGIDVGAKADVYRFIKRLVERGACVILSTSELPELINLSSRVYIMREGAIVAEIEDSEMHDTGILRHYFGTNESVEAAS
ncbi:sugar ABC transporter ATP-binding protein [Rhizobium rhizogenes]|uniref:Sugar ABC transporter ATP-binding protein n=1 Tax=Rhizobium rhizogenes TaxID=359 RepID=A0AA92H7G0_RHIRH|nr:sugar ABC transporter ATP-binding protein [Rhizobium rhizogenes]PVE50602.1 sugar ABC transporter ATP-binding protein [Rhizobium rhizogenes]PVE62397.1 sugar ABC transporter ATP-binding protein [Agrobacterium tumefaciens]PVE70580.1 sugar ABC transporter ATP-binding protein [Sphingomonas sp. TPD3009]